MKLYNTLTRQKDEFKPLEPGKVGIYTCGPTVYMFAHIGNFRAYVFSDTLRRVLEYLGYKVKHVMNITDVGHLTSDQDTGEDKLEKGAREEHKTPEQIARFYEDAFFTDSAKLNILRPHVVCRATDHIQDMIELVRRIDEKGYAYRTGVGLIYDTARYEDYWRLGRLNLAEQKAGFRVEVDPERRNPSDFALWVTNQPKHLMQWDSPWGRGFPGWHLECSAMSVRYLGERFDIHTGGIDHIPVHHTNERAQNVAAFGHEVVNRWMHNAFLTLGDARMGKSEGNLITISELEEQGHEPMAFRYLCHTALYRMPLSFTPESMAGARNSLRGLLDFGRNAQTWKSGDSPRPGEPGRNQGQSPISSEENWTVAYRNEFREAIADDLNIPQALAVVWNLIREANQRQDRRAWDVLLDFDQVLGLGLEESTAAGIPDEVQQLADERQAARKAKDWARADELRQKIADMGYSVEDTPGGIRLKPR